MIGIFDKTKRWRISLNWNMWKKLKGNFQTKNKIIKNLKNGFKNILDTPEKRISELKKRSVESVQNKVQRRKKYFKNFWRDKRYVESDVKI